MVLISMRVPEPMRDELRALAEEASKASGRRVTRADVHRAMTADGIRRARSARRYVGKLAGDLPAATGKGAGAPDTEGAR